LRNVDSGESIRLQSVEGIGEDSFFTMVDELTRRIKTSLELSPEKDASDIDDDVGKITTSSLEAYQAYVDSWKDHISFDWKTSPCRYLCKVILQAWQDL
jgi:hypothetical protein